jgi:hypothetical protein
VDVEADVGVGIDVGVDVDVDVDVDVSIRRIEGQGGCSEVGSRPPADGSML